MEKERGEEMEKETERDKEREREKEGEREREKEGEREREIIMCSVIEPRYSLILLAKHLYAMTVLQLHERGQAELSQNARLRTFAEMDPARRQKLIQ